MYTPREQVIAKNISSMYSNADKFAPQEDLTKGDGNDLEKGEGGEQVVENTATPLEQLLQRREDRRNRS